MPRNSWFPQLAAWFGDAPLGTVPSAGQKGVWVGAEVPVSGAGLSASTELAAITPLG